MMNREQMVDQFEYLEELLRNECVIMDDEKYRFNIGMLAAFGMVLDSQKNRFIRRYADTKCDCDVMRKGCVR